MVEMVEVWLVIEDYPNYSVSSLGRVKNRRTGRILRDGPNSGGYPCVSLFQDGERTQHRVHRLVLDAFRPTDERNLDVNHLDRDKTNNAIWNLEWTTHEENLRHASETGFRSRASSVSGVRIRETGQEFSSISACAREINGERRGVERCLSGQNDSYRGYTFEYVW